MSGARITILPEQLERFARELGLTQAILVGWAPDGTTHVVTWGDSLTNSAQAAQGGNFVKRALGFPETLCRALSPRVAAALAETEASPTFADLVALATERDAFLAKGALRHWIDSGTHHVELAWNPEDFVHGRGEHYWNALREALQKLRQKRERGVEPGAVP